MCPAPWFEHCDSAASPLRGTGSEHSSCGLCISWSSHLPTFTTPSAGPHPTPFSFTSELMKVKVKQKRGPYWAVLIGLGLLTAADSFSSSPPYRGRRSYHEVQSLDLKVTGLHHRRHAGKREKEADLESVRGEEAELDVLALSLQVPSASLGLEPPQGVHVLQTSQVFSSTNVSSISLLSPPKAPRGHTQSPALTRGM